MPRPTITDRVRLFTDAETAGGTDKADLAKALKAAAKDLEASAKPAKAEGGDASTTSGAGSTTGDTKTK